MSDAKKPPRTRAPKPAKPGAGGSEVPSAVAASGGQVFKLLNFERQKGLIVAPPNLRLVRMFEEALAHAKIGDFKVGAVIAVTPDGASAMQFIHSGSTIAALLAANRMLENALVQALATTYTAPPGTILEKVPPQHEDPSEDEVE